MDPAAIQVRGIQVSRYRLPSLRLNPGALMALLQHCSDFLDLFNSGPQPNECHCLHCLRLATASSNPHVSKPPAHTSPNLGRRCWESAKHDEPLFRSPEDHLLRIQQTMASGIDSSWALTPEYRILLFILYYTIL